VSATIFYIEMHAYNRHQQQFPMAVRQELVRRQVQQQIEMGNLPPPPPMRRGRPTLQDLEYRKLRVNKYLLIVIGQNKF